MLFFSEGLVSYCGFSQKQNSRQELKCIGEVLGPLVGRGQVESAYWASYHSELLGLNPAGKIQNTCLVMVTPRDEEAGIFIPQLPRILAWGLLLRVLIPQHFQPAEVLGEKSLGMETQKQGWPVHPSPVRFKGREDYADSLALRKPELRCCRPVLTSHAQEVETTSDSKTSLGNPAPAQDEVRFKAPHSSRWSHTWESQPKSIGSSS